MRILKALTILLLFTASVAYAAEPPFGIWEWAHTETSDGEYVNTLEAGDSLQRVFREDMSFTEYLDEVPVLTGVFWVQDIVIEGSDYTVLSMDFGGISPARSPYLVNNNGMLQMYWGVDQETGLPSYPIEYFTSREPTTIEFETWDGFKALFR